MVSTRAGVSKLFENQRKASVHARSPRRFGWWRGVEWRVSILKVTCQAGWRADIGIRKIEYRNIFETFSRALTWWPTRLTVMSIAGVEERARRISVRAL